MQGNDKSAREKQLEYMILSWSPVFNSFYTCEKVVYGVYYFSNHKVLEYK